MRLSPLHIVFRVAVVSTVPIALGAAPRVEVDTHTSFAEAQAWLLPLADTDDGVRPVDDRLSVQGLALQRTNGEPWPETFTLELDGQTEVIRLGRLKTRSPVVLRFETARALHSLRVTVLHEPIDDALVHVILEEFFRGDSLDKLLPQVSSPPPMGSRISALLAHASEPVFDGLGRAWKTMPASAQLTALDTVGPSRCGPGLPFLLRVFLDGGELGDRSERLLVGCGSRAAGGIALRFDGADGPHRAKLARLYAGADPSRAFASLLEASSSSEGPLRVALRSALERSAKHFSSEFIQAKLSDSSVSLRSRLALAGAVTVAQNEGALSAVVESGVKSLDPHDRRRAALLARDLPLASRRTMAPVLLAAYDQESSATSRVLYTDSLWPVVGDEARQRFLTDKSPSVRAAAGLMAKEARSPSISPAVAAQLERETWFEPAKALAEALATVAPNDHTREVLAAKENDAKTSLFAAAFLRARALSGDPKVASSAKKKLRDDQAPLALRVASAEALVVLGDSSVNHELVRLAMRAQDPVSEDDSPLAYACLEALEVLATSADRETLVPLVTVKDPAIRALARRVVHGGAVPSTTAPQ